MFPTTSPELAADLQKRWDEIQPGIKGLDAGALMVCTPVNLLYLTGRVFNGFVWLPRKGPPQIFMRRMTPEDAAPNVHAIRNPEEIPKILLDNNLPVGKWALEGEELAWGNHVRLSRLCEASMNSQPASGSGLLRRARSIKTPYETAIMREGGLRQARAITTFSRLYKPGMTDHQFALECEHVIRRAGSLGLFRINGQSMECFMGSVLAGCNAAAVSPYDFALGGAGLDPSLPVGQNGTKLEPGMTVMVDVAYNCRGYLTDCSRTYSVGKPPEEALAAHKCCVEIQHTVAKAMQPGVVAEKLYQMALDMAAAAGYADRFMGLAQKAKFIGHGTGLYINEWPVIGARAAHEICVGNVIALEPKIVLPGIGAVGVEDTFVVTETGAENITPCAQKLMELE